MPAIGSPSARFLDLQMTDTKKSGPRFGPALYFSFCSRSYACGAVLEFGDTTGGQGLLGVGVMPGFEGDVLLPVLGAVGAGDGLPGVAGDVPLLAPFVGPGKVPHGEPLGEVPGVFGVLGLIVDGCVVPPGVGVAGEVEPGTAGLGVVCGVCGVA